MMDMKKLMITLGLLVAMITNVTAQQIKAKDKPLASVLQQIQKQTGIHFYWLPKEIEGISVTVDTDCKELDVLMGQLLAGTDLKYTVFNNRYVHILKNRVLVNQMPAFSLWHIEGNNNGLTASTLLTDGKKADSENKVYVIGDREKPSEAER